jgi:hypothetical protein
MVSPVRGDHRRFQAETPLIAFFKSADPASASFRRYDAANKSGHWV